MRPVPCEHPSHLQLRPRPLKRVSNGEETELWPGTRAAGPCPAGQEAGEAATARGRIGEAQGCSRRHREFRSGAAERLTVAHCGTLAQWGRGPPMKDRQHYWGPLETPFGKFAAW